MKRDFYNSIIKAYETETFPDDQVKKETIEFLNHQIELLDKRSNSPRKPSKNQVANEGVKEDIKEALAGYENPVTVTELLTNDLVAGMSPQKITALLSQLVKAGIVVRTEEKRKAYFSLA